SLVDLSGDESLQAADDVTLGEPFCGASGDVVDGGPVVLHTDDDSAVDGGVGLAVSAPVEAVTVGHPRRSGNRAGAAQLGESGLGTDPFGVVAEDDEHL